MAQEEHTIICVDFGMTGSAFSWKHTDQDSSHASWSKLSEKKTPTRLVFCPENENGQPIAWGSQPTNLPARNIKECFKTFMGVENSKLAESDIPGAPKTKEELHHWIKEYLKAFCREAVVTEIDKSLLPTWKKANIEWKFTVPGHWSQFPAVADFARLAEQAVSSILHEAKHVILTDVTEARASAMCLLVNGLVAKNKAYALGSTIISCDIGGSSIDIAASRVCGQGTLVDLCQLQSDYSSGFTTIQKDVFLHVMQTLTCAGAHCPSELALEFVRDSRTIEILQKFEHQEGSDWVSAWLPEGCEVRNWRPSQHGGSRASYIADSRILIDRDVIKGFLNNFLGEVEKALDGAITAAVANELHPDIIGFCGGGSRNMYIMENLHQKYSRGGRVIVTPADLITKPEMATISGNRILWDQDSLRTYVSQTTFGIKDGDSIKWGCAEECSEPSTFETPYAMVVNFNCEKHRNYPEHRIFALSGAKPTAGAVPEATDTTMKSLPETVEEALKTSRCRSWTVAVDLSKEHGSTLSSKKRYQIVCKIVGAHKVEFKAHSLKTNAKIPCELIKNKS